MATKETLPNSTAVLVLGICSIVFGCFFVGLILGIVGLNLAGKGRKMYSNNPELYDGYGALNAVYEENMDGTKNAHELKNLIIDEVKNTINFYEDKNLVKGVFKSEDGNIIIEFDDANYTRLK